MSGKPTILVVDDDRPILALMHNVLGMYGFHANVAATGEDALTSARNSRPALILVDRNMPGMTGDQLIAALRAEATLHHVPILVLSGEPLSAAEVTRLRVDGAVLKPFDLAALIAQIRSFVDRPQPSPASEDRAGR